MIRRVLGTECGVVSSLVDLSLYKLSLSSSKGARPSISPLASNGIYESSPVCEVGPRPNPLDFMDEGCFSSGPLVENVSGGTSKFPDENAVVLKKNLSQFKDNNQAAPSSLAMDERTIKHFDLEDIREIGSGTYGTVFYGKWKGPDVAIKRIKRTCFSGSELEKDRLIADFWKEAHILGQLHHPNVVTFYGVVKDGPVTNLATVTEYMVNGSLKQVLQRRDRTIDRRKRILIAMDAAFGMEYLHEKHIAHFNLKSHNFLVNMRDPQRPVCKIGDMGLSKVKQKTLILGGVRGTLSWMAPEILTCEKSMVTEKVDIYSFGIVMWELLTGEEPYALLRPEESIGVARACTIVWRFE